MLAWIAVILPVFMYVTGRTMRATCLLSRQILIIGFAVPNSTTGIGYRPLHVTLDGRVILTLKIYETLMVAAVIKFIDSLRSSFTTSSSNSLTEIASFPGRQIPVSANLD